MAALVELPNDGCRGLDMLDGTRYDAHEGYVEVHERYVPSLREVRDGTLRLVGSRVTAFSAAPGITCPSCRFERLAAFAARPCPRCGWCEPEAFGDAGG